MSEDERINWLFQKIALGQLPNHQRQRSSEIASIFFEFGRISPPAKSELEEIARTALARRRGKEHQSHTTSSNH